MNLEKTKWPDGKKCAAMLTINLNAELFWLQIDPSCKDMPKTLSLGQYGMTRGVDRILSILKERGIKATFFTPGWVAEQYPDKLKRIKEEGHEIASLAYKHENMALLTEEEQEEAMKKGIEAIQNVCGVTPVGFRAPEGELTLDTLRIVISVMMTVHIRKILKMGKRFWRFQFIGIIMICHTLHLIIIRHFQRDREELQIIRVLLITGKMNFTDAMNMVYVTFYSLTRQPLVHQEELVF